MAYNNQIILRGNLGKDPEVIPNPDGSTRVEITICTQDAYKVNEDWKQLPEVWHKVTFFGQQAQQHVWMKMKKNHQNQVNIVNLKAQLERE